MAHNFKEGQLKKNHDMSLLLRDEQYSYIDFDHWKWQHQIYTYKTHVIHVTANPQKKKIVQFFASFFSWSFLVSVCCVNFHFSIFSLAGYISCSHLIHLFMFLLLLLSFQIVVCNFKKCSRDAAGTDWQLW